MSHPTSVEIQAKRCAGATVRGNRLSRGAHTRQGRPIYPVIATHLPAAARADYCVGGNAALMPETPSAPAILQMGCEKSARRLGTGTNPW